MVTVAIATIAGFIETSSDYYGIVPCEENEDCAHLENAECKNITCFCNGSRLCSEKSVAVVTKIGEDCQEDSNCNMDFSVCDKHDKCSCIEGFVKSTDGKRCLLISEGVGGSCEDSVQCYTKTQHTGCQNNKCVCQQQMHEYNRSCYRNVELGQHCQNNAECSTTEFSKCIESKCSCLAGYVASTKGSRCLSVADGENFPCVDTAQCTETLGQEYTNKCVRDMLLGDLCVNNSDCYGAEPGFSTLECIIGICKCKSFLTEHHGYCLSSSGKQETSTFMQIGICLITISATRYFRF
ncbi:hypothetical protein JTB14_032429 [Gonioctena quinquepunctata]|nr:hypothetical protein JTB14_032429 [Gonioctena quinquepunctata]